MKLFDQFTNEVFCRRESNHRKAQIIWKEIRVLISSKESIAFEIEWNHYCLGEIEPDDFAFYVNELKVVYQDNLKRKIFGGVNAPVT